MSQQSKTTLQSAINAQIADNTSGDISAADIRDNLINITDSLLFNTGSEQSLTGSLNVTEGITGSLLGTATTASYVTGSIYTSTNPALSASYALSSSRTIAANRVLVTGAGGSGTLYPLLGSTSVGDASVNIINSLDYKYNLSTNQLIISSISASSFTGSLSGSATSASYALSASYAPATTTFPFTGSAIVSGSLGVTGSVAVAEGGGIIITSSSPIAKIAITDGSIRNEMTKVYTVITNPSSPSNFSLGSYVYDPINNPFFPLSNAIYSGGTTDLLISSQQKLNLEATSVEITGSLVTSGSIIGVALTSSTSGTAGINYQSDLTTVIPSLQLASSNNLYNLRIFSPTLQQNYISSSHQLYLYTNSNLGIKAGNGSSAVGNVTIATGTNSGTITMTAFSSMTFTASAATYNTSTFTINAPTTRVTSSLGVTGSIDLNGLITLQPLDPLPSATNGSIAYSSSGDFYFASGSAWNKLTL